MASAQIQSKTTMEDDEGCLFALQLASATVLPMVMGAAMELDLFEIIAKAGVGGQLSAKQIADQLPTQSSEAPLMLDRMLRLLSCHSILTWSLVTHEDGKRERVYGLGPVCKYFVRNQDGVSISPLMLLNQDKVFMDSWYHLKDAVLGGGVAFQKAHGVHLFDYSSTDPRFSQVINKAFVNHTTILMTKIFETYEGFEDLKDVVDVGGGVGAALSMITSKYPTTKGINFDLPHVIARAPSYPGVEHVGGDMFESVPKGEAIFMKSMFHDWSDELCVELLKKCYEALPDHGKMIILEGILPEVPETSIAAKGLYDLDLLMLAQTHGGKERTESEYKTLFDAANFTNFRKVCCIYNYGLIECYKNV